MRTLDRSFEITVTGFLSFLSILSGVLLYLIQVYKINPRIAKSRHIQSRIPTIVSKEIYSMVIFLILGIPSNTFIWCIAYPFIKSQILLNLIGSFFFIILFFPIVSLHLTRLWVLKLQYMINHLKCICNESGENGSDGWKKYHANIWVRIYANKWSRIPKYLLSICLFMGIGIVCIYYGITLFLLFTFAKNGDNWMITVVNAIVFCFPTLVAIGFALSLIGVQDNFMIKREEFWILAVMTLILVFYATGSVTIINHIDDCAFDLYANFLCYLGVSMSGIIHAHYSLISVKKKASKYHLKEVLRERDTLSIFFQFLVSELSCENLEMFILAMRWRYRLVQYHHKIIRKTLRDAQKAQSEKELNQILIGLPSRVRGKLNFVRDSGTGFYQISRAINNGQSGNGMILGQLNENEADERESPSDESPPVAITQENADGADDADQSPSVQIVHANQDSNAVIELADSNNNENRVTIKKLAGELESQTNWVTPQSTKAGFPHLTFAFLDHRPIDVSEKHIHRHQQESVMGVQDLNRVGFADSKRDDESTTKTVKENHQRLPTRHVPVTRPANSLSGPAKTRGKGKLKSIIHRKSPSAHLTGMGGPSLGSDYTVSVESDTDERQANQNSNPIQDDDDEDSGMDKLQIVAEMDLDESDDFVAGALLQGDDNPPPLTMEPVAGGQTGVITKGLSLSVKGDSLSSKKAGGSSPKLPERQTSLKDRGGSSQNHPGYGTTLSPSVRSESRDPDHKKVHKPVGTMIRLPTNAKLGKFESGSVNYRPSELGFGKAIPRLSAVNEERLSEKITLGDDIQADVLQLTASDLGLGLVANCSNMAGAANGNAGMNGQASMNPNDPSSANNSTVELGSGSNRFGLLFRGTLYTDNQLIDDMLLSEEIDEKRVEEFLLQTNISFDRFNECVDEVNVSFEAYSEARKYMDEYPDISSFYSMRNTVQSFDIAFADMLTQVWENLLDSFSRFPRSPYYDEFLHMVETINMTEAGRRTIVPSTIDEDIEE